MPHPISQTRSLVPVVHADRRRFAPEAAPSTSESPIAPQLKTACDEMESLFIHYMLSEMRKTVPRSGVVDGGRAEEIYTSLMDAELAKNMATSGGLGLAKMLQEQISARGAVFEKKSSER